MNWLDYIKAFILGAVEGITEFLPVSSTGHLIITADLIEFDGPLADTFAIAIQLGAILSVCWVYRAKLWDVLRGLGNDTTAQRCALNLLLAFLPSAILGFFLYEAITTHLFNPYVVACALIAGGVLILLVERFHYPVDVVDIDAMDWKHAIKIGCMQALALIPGTSRSGATIIGALLFGLSRRAATEFSFFLAIPTMFAATAYDVYKHRHALDVDQIGLFAVGFAVAFLSALLAVKTFLRYIAHHDFSVFAWYRILFGAIVLWYYW
ncbi:MAG: undecaprenyl-diphosphate phosphatase [Chromatiales bacterium]